MTDSDPVIDDVVDASPASERRDGSEVNKFRRAVFEVPVTLQVSLGSTRLTIAEIMALDVDSVVQLAAGIDDPVQLLVDQRVIAHGELIETDEGGLAVRIIEVPEDGQDDD